MEKLTHYHKILLWNKMKVKDLPETLQHCIEKAEEFEQQYNNDRKISNLILDFLKENNPTQEIISFEESIKIIAQWEQEGDEEEAEEPLKEKTDVEEPKKIDEEVPEETMKPIYKFKITNHSNQPKKAVIFGAFENMNKKNHGSDEGIEITMLEQLSNYSDTLKKVAAADDFKVGSILLSSKNANQMKQVITKKDAQPDGNGKLNHLVTEQFLNDEDGVHESIVSYEYKHNNLTSLIVEILPATTLELFMLQNVYLVEEVAEEKSPTKEVKEKSDEGVIEEPIKVEEKTDVEEINHESDEVVGSSIESHEGITKEGYRELFLIKIKNPTKETKVARLFGFCKNYNKENSNFGSDEGLEISSYNHLSYQEILAQSALKPFKTSLIRLKSENESQVKQIITLASKDANSQSCTVPVITMAYFTPRKSSVHINEVDYCVVQDAFTEWEIPILAESELELHIYPNYNFDNQESPQIPDWAEESINKWKIKNEGKEIPMPFVFMTQDKHDEIIKRLQDSEDRIKELESKKWWQNNKSSKK